MSGGSTCIGKGGINMSGGGGLHAWQRGGYCLTEGGLHA